jgi:hypothetical protein
VPRSARVESNGSCFSTAFTAQRCSLLSAEMVLISTFWPVCTAGVRQKRKLLASSNLLYV